jgi:hypothetical protein
VLPPILGLRSTGYEFDRKRGAMAESQFLEKMEGDVIRMGGAVKRGLIEKRELQNDEEIRVSIRSSKCLGSIELFTLRHLKPADYQLMLVAIPRNKDMSLYQGKYRRQEGEDIIKGGRND